jgi:hypothetical protein
VLDSAPFMEREIERSLVEVSSRRIRGMQVQVVARAGSRWRQSSVPSPGQGGWRRRRRMVNALRSSPMMRWLEAFCEKRAR